MLDTVQKKRRAEAKNLADRNAVCQDAGRVHAAQQGTDAATTEGQPGDVGTIPCPLP
jgi:hypothetical protein